MVHPSMRSLTQAPTTARTLTEAPHEDAPLNKLPMELKYMIIDECDTPSLTNVAHTSKEWFQTISDYIAKIRPHKLMDLNLDLGHLYAIGLNDEVIIKALKHAPRSALVPYLNRIAWVRFRGFCSIWVTPFHIAAAQGNQRMVEFFLDKKIPLKPVNCEISVLEYVIMAGNIDMLKFLIQKGISLETKELHAIHIAAGVGSKEIVDVLLHNEPALINQRNFGGTPVMWALASPELVSREMVPYLITRGAKFIEKDTHRRSPGRFPKLRGANSDAPTFCPRSSRKRVIYDRSLAQEFSQLMNSGEKHHEHDIRQFLDRIFVLSQNCHPDQAAQHLDEALHHLEAANIFPWTAYEEIRRMVSDFGDFRHNRCYLSSMFEGERGPRILAWLNILLERCPSQDGRDSFPPTILKLIDALNAHGLSLDQQGCQTLLMRTPMGLSDKSMVKRWPKDLKEPF